MTRLKYVWHTLMGLVYLGVVVAVLSVARTRFEALVLAGLVEVYAAVLYNFSVVGTAMDANNYANFCRFKILAAAQGITASEDGTFEEVEHAMIETIKGCKTAFLTKCFERCSLDVCAFQDCSGSVF
jgi:hypothetical protein